MLVKFTLNKQFEQGLLNEAFLSFLFAFYLKLEKGNSLEVKPKNIAKERYCKSFFFQGKFEVVQIQ